MASLDWIVNLGDSIWQWLLSLRSNQHPGIFYFCRKGSILQPSPRTGLYTSCFALKICYQINRLDQVENHDLREWTEYIRSFQSGPGAKFKGLFEDKTILKRVDRRVGWFRKDIATRRAETRQACAALLGAGVAPRWPVLSVPNSIVEIEKYLSKLPWYTNPWGAGSHVSHLVFFLKLNADFFNREMTFREALPIILRKLDSLQDKETGSWFLGKPTPQQIVNAAMKIITLYELLKKPFNYPERLIDFCLEVTGNEDACHIVNAIYVLYQCSRLTSYRAQDILSFAEGKLDIIKKHYKTDGAFSFFADRAGTTYYGVRVSKGYSESDVHGTHLLVWALTMIGELIGFNKELRWKLPIT
jgi:hypothetical protein